MSIRQLSIFLENKSGRLAEITQALTNANIDIRALCIADTSDYGILRMIVNDPDKAVEVLTADGIMLSLTEVIGVVLDDKPGGLNTVMQVLYIGNVDTEYMYAFLNPQTGKAALMLRVADAAATANMLRSAGFTLLDDSDILAM